MAAKTAVATGSPAPGTLLAATVPAFVTKDNVAAIKDLIAKGTR